MTITTDKISKDPLCEGWLEKLALRRGFSLLSSKGWNRRYCFLTRRGLGYGHANPRDKNDAGKKVSLRPADAKCFIPFDRHKGRETMLLPVYYIRDVSVTKNPEVPSESMNGICTNMATSPEDSKPHRYYYFGITFEEKKKRYTLFLRTDSSQEYVKWTSFLPLYVHQACQSTIVPYAHPLEVNRQPPVDMNRRRLVNKDSEAVSEGYYMRDPDPCTNDEYQTIRRRCLLWNEGERVRVFPAAKASVKERAAGSDIFATKSLEEEQQLTFEQRVEMLEAIADALCADPGDDSPGNGGEVEEGGDISADSEMERVAAAALNDSRNVVLGSAHDGLSVEAAAQGDEIGAMATTTKTHGRHRSGHHHSKHDGKNKGQGKEEVYSNSSANAGVTSPPPANKPSRSHSGLGTITFTGKDEAMKGSNDTNGGPTPRLERARPEKKTRKYNAKVAQDPNQRQGFTPDVVNNHTDPQV